MSNTSYTAQPIKLPDRLPLGPLRDTVIFPSTTVPIASGRPKSKAALDSAYLNNRLIVFVAQKNARVEDPSEKDLYQVGTVCLLRRMIKNPEGEYTVSAEGLVRVFIKNITHTDQ